MAGKKEKRKKKKKSGHTARETTIFRFILFVSFLLFFSFVGAIALNSLMVRNELRLRAVEKKIQNELSCQRELRVKIARLSSPGRIARIAVDRLGLREPETIVFLKFRKKQDGSIASYSTVERVARLAVGPERETRAGSFAYRSDGVSRDER